ncbi:MAG: FAD-dependent oxidoreductase [Candidatus Woesebacteria bacterium]|nr:MAG: FAD-dependent oxidoreductase [Candidatus Woesebacteria bacterium]
MKLKLVKKNEEAKGSVSFFWEPEKPVNFLAGQYYYFTIPRLIYPDPKGTTRHFTISSSPTEGNLLRLTTKIREESGYKKTLDELPIGAEVEGEGPNGTFIFDEMVTGPQVFIAGGIGITPFRSMIKYLVDKNLKTPIYLIYSNSKDDFVFKKELDEMIGAHQSIKIKYLVTEVDGRLDELKINRFIGDWKLEIGNLTWWLCGPPPMIDAMEQVLGKLKITSDKIRSEKFTGY